VLLWGMEFGEDWEIAELPIHHMECGLPRLECSGGWLVADSHWPRISATHNCLTNCQTESLWRQARSGAHQRKSRPQPVALREAREAFMPAGRMGLSRPPALRRRSLRMALAEAGRCRREGRVAPAKQGPHRRLPILLNVAPVTAGYGRVWRSLGADGRIG
jgi:hypothetical protein